MLTKLASTRLWPFAAALAAAGMLAACGGGADSPTLAETGTSADPLENRAIVALASQAPLPGAIYTSTAGCTATNVNQYDTKQAVYLNGGPAAAGAAGLLPNTSYYVRVTTPSGSTVLGTSGTAQPVTTDSSGKFSACYQLWPLVRQSDTSAGFADTDNSGGEYKVWISTSSTFDNASTKTDNFKVRSTTPPPPPAGGTVVVRKWYDANTNGAWDSGEPEMQAPVNGWRVDLTGFAPTLTRATFTPVKLETVVAREYRPVETNWYATNAYLGTAPVLNAPSFDLAILNQIAVPLSASSTTATVNFGDVCTGAGGGRTLGFWSNRNGQALVTDGMLAGLRAMNLAGDTGAPFDPQTYAELESWLLRGRATNMANMLSVQMTAMKLNVLSGLVDGNSLVLAMGAAGANAAGFMTVNALVAEADASLGQYAYTRAGMQPRMYQELLKNALDAANNDRSFVQATPCTALTFPATP